MSLMFAAPPMAVRIASILSALCVAACATERPITQGPKYHAIEPAMLAHSVHIGDELVVTTGTSPPMQLVVRSVQPEAMTVSILGSSELKRIPFDQVTQAKRVQHATERRSSWWSKAAIGAAAVAGAIAIGVISASGGGPPAM